MKQPLALVAGLLSNESLWQHQVSHLREIADISVFHPNQDSADKMVKAILDAAPPKFALAGHSMGGWLCLEILRAAPSRVTKLCLLNTTARDDSPAKKDKREAMIAQCRAGHFAEVAQEITDLFIHNSLVKKDVEAMFHEVGPEAFINQETAMLNRRPSEDILPNIICPALVVHAAHDRVFSLEEHQELVNGMPNAKLVIVDDSGHMSPLEVPQIVTALLRSWLSLERH